MVSNAALLLQLLALDIIHYRDFKHSHLLCRDIASHRSPRERA